MSQFVKEDQEPTEETTITEVEESTNQDDIVEDVEIPEIELGDKRVPYDKLLEVWNKAENGESFTAEATKKTQQLAEEKREFDQAKLDFEQQQREWYNQNRQSQSQKEVDTSNIPEEIADDPVMAAIYKENQELKSEFKNFKKDFEQDSFLREIDSRHARIKSVHDDYDPMTIEKSIASGKRDHFEDAYLADKYKAVQKGDKDVLLSLLPEETKKDLIEQGRKSMLEELRKKNNIKGKIATQKPSGNSINSMAKDSPKSYKEANAQTLNILKEKGISLIKT